MKSAAAQLTAFSDTARPGEELKKQILVAAKRNAPKHVIRDAANISAALQEIAVPNKAALSRRSSDPHYDSFLYIESSFQIESSGQIDPDLTLSVTVNARLIVSGDHAQIYSRQWRYRGDPRNYFALAADDAKLLRLEFENAYFRLAEKIIFDLFVTDDAEIRRGWEVGVAVSWAATIPSPTGSEGCR